jgi:hypothetical protein
MTWWLQWLDAIFDEITFFFFALSFSSFFFYYDSVAAAADNNIHTYTQRQQRARKKKWGSLFFSFSFSSFTSFYYFEYGAASAAMSRWCSCFFEERQNDKEEREREMRWFRFLCLGKQQSIDLLFIIGHYFLLYSVYLSLSLSFFFVNSAYIHTHSCSPILVIAPCFTNTSINVQMKRVMTVVPLY